MLHVEVPAHAAKAVGRAQLLPAVGGIDGAGELLGIDEGFDQHDGMTVASLPVGRQAIQRQTQGAGTEIGKRFVRQEQKSAVIDDQGQTPTALLLAPADPVVTGAQPA